MHFISLATRLFVIKFTQANSIESSTLLIICAENPQITSVIPEQKGRNVANISMHWTMYIVVTSYSYWSKTKKKIDERPPVVTCKITWHDQRHHMNQQRSYHLTATKQNKIKPCVYNMGVYCTHEYIDTWALFIYGWARSTHNKEDITFVSSSVNS